MPEYEPTFAEACFLAEVVGSLTGAMALHHELLRERPTDDGEIQAAAIQEIAVSIGRVNKSLGRLQDVIVEAAAPAMLDELERWLEGQTGEEGDDG
jgi:hypothetical protein